MSGRKAYSAARIFDGEDWHERSALVVNGDRVEAIIAANSPTDAIRVPLGDGILVPGLVDLQINGGGGTQFNNTPTLAGIEAICATALRAGTTALLPTLITDTAATRAAAIEAGREAARKGVTGFVGLHLEGPHLSAMRAGAHDPALIHSMSEADLLALVEARAGLPNLLITVAPEAVTPNQITRLVEAGIVVSLGHSAAGYGEAKAAAEAGATMVTHLFNAQSQLGSREPGLVGAGLDLGGLWCGIIADGIHVDAVGIGVALRAKRGPGRIFLVSDAMAIAGTSDESFTLNGRTVRREGGALRLADGTLAGADFTPLDAVTYMHRTVGRELGEALRMASLYPAEALGVAGDYGHLRQGARADFLHLSDALTLEAIVVGGEAMVTP